MRLVVFYIYIGKKWFQRRKILTPAFHFKILEQYIEIFDRQTNVMVEKMSRFAETDPVDILSVVTLCALDVIGGKLLFRNMYFIFVYLGNQFF